MLVLRCCGCVCSMCAVCVCWMNSLRANPEKKQVTASISGIKRPKDH